MSTKLQLVNRLLRRMRQDEVTTSIDTPYSKLVIELLNEAKREVEDAHDWIHLRDSIDVTTVSGTFQYALTNAKDRFRILKDPIKGPPYMDVYDETNKEQLKKAPSSQWMTEKKLEGTDGNAPPRWFDINGQDSNGDPYVNLHPTPAGAYTVQFNLVIPQADFSTSSTSDDSTEMTVPDFPVVLLAYYLLIQERGEEDGANADKLLDRYERALADAISKEAGMLPEEFTWNVR